MRIISPAETSAIAVSYLGFDSESVDLTAPEPLAAVIRKTGSFLCPCTGQALARAVTGLLRPLHPDNGLDEVVRDAIDSAVGYGDLVEASDVDVPNGVPLLYLAPPSFVQVSDSLFLIFGIIPDGEDPIPPELTSAVTPAMCTRRLHVRDARDASESLLQAGFIRLKLEGWLKCPPIEPAAEFLSRYENALSQSGPPGTPEDIVILDQSRWIRHYNSRWTQFKKQTGRFIARRSQAYGSPLWSYLEAIDGRVTRLLDLPHFESRWNAFDEAWHLSQAIDSVAGHPQRFETRTNAQTSTVTIKFFSPVPAWATRRWDTIGQRTVPSSALLSYVFSKIELDAECKFATERMWLKHV